MKTSAHRRAAYRAQPGPHTHHQQRILPTFWLPSKTDPEDILTRNGNFVLFDSKGDHFVGESEKLSLQRFQVHLHQLNLLPRLQAVQVVPGGFARLLGLQGKRKDGH